MIRLPLGFDLDSKRSNDFLNSYFSLVAFRFLQHGLSPWRLVMLADFGSGILCCVLRIAIWLMGLNRFDPVGDRDSIRRSLVSQQV